MLFLIFTGQLLEHAKLKVINPNIEGGGRIFCFFSGGCGQVWVLFPVFDEFTCVRQEDLGSRKCRLSTIDASKVEKEEGEKVGSGRRRK
jgi:hypothetical protein